MNEQQINQYTQLIGLFLYCNNEEEMEKILQDNAAIIDEQFITFIENHAKTFSDQGQQDTADKLTQLVQFLQQQLSVTPYINLIKMLLNCSNPEELMETLENHQSLVNETLFTEIKQYANDLQEQGQGEKADFLSGLSQQFQQALTNPWETLNQTATTLYQQGKYADAIPIAKQALQVAIELYGQEDNNVATSLNNLAELYHSQGRYREAEPLYKDALALRKKLLGDKHPDVATSFNNLAELYHSQGRYTEAEPLYKDALALRKKLLGDEHLDVAGSFNNLAGLYCAQGRYTEAEPLYKDALALTKKLLGDEHPSVATSLNNLAALYESQGKVETALTYFLHSLAVEEKIIQRVFTSSSERQRIQHINQNRTTLDGYLSLVTTHFNGEEKSNIQTALTTVLNRKCLTLAAQATQNFAVYRGNYSHLLPTFQELQQVSKEIIDASYSPYSPEYKPRLTKLQNRYDDLERQLAKQIPEMALKEQKVTCEQLANALPDNSFLVEFIYIDYWDFDQNKWTEPRYIAFVLPAGQPDKVTMIDLGNANEINTLLIDFYVQISHCPIEVYTPEKTPHQTVSTYAIGFGEDSTPTHQDRGLFLSEKLWKPIHHCVEVKSQNSKVKNSPETDTKPRLFIAADHALNLIPFEVLPLDETQKLRDLYSISYLTTGRDILRKQIKTNRTPSEPLIIADPDYNLEVRSMNSEIGSSSLKNSDELNTFLSTLDDSEKGLKRAKGTDILAKEVATYYNVTPYLDKNALTSHLTPETCPRVLLIGTHGVFFSPPKEPPSNLQLHTSDFTQDRFQQNINPDPMLTSVLAFAGANTWRKGGQIPNEAGTGHLLAKDVAGLDLWENDLTVLCACQTGIGNVNAGEGIFGLRRAFVVAGTKTLLMSLWSVPAHATVLLLTLFFDNRKARMSPHLALEKAQNTIQNLSFADLKKSKIGNQIIQELINIKLININNTISQDTIYPLSHPYFWSGWICQNLLD